MSTCDAAFWRCFKRSFLPVCLSMLETILNQGGINNLRINCHSTTVPNLRQIFRSFLVNRFDLKPVRQRCQELNSSSHENRKEMHHKGTRETRDREHGKALLALCNKEENHRSPRYIEQEREEKEPRQPHVKSDYNPPS